MDLDHEQTVIKALLTDACIFQADCTLSPESRDVIKNVLAFLILLFRDSSNAAEALGKVVTATKSKTGWSDVPFRYLDFEVSGEWDPEDPHYQRPYLEDAVRYFNHSFATKEDIQAIEIDLNTAAPTPGSVLLTWVLIQDPRVYNTITTLFKSLETDLIGDDPVNSHCRAISCLRDEHILPHRYTPLSTGNPLVKVLLYVMLHRSSAAFRAAREMIEPEIEARTWRWGREPARRLREVLLSRNAGDAFVPLPTGHPRRCLGGVEEWAGMLRRENRGYYDCFRKYYAEQLIGFSIAAYEREQQRLWVAATQRERSPYRASETPDLNPEEALARLRSLAQETLEGITQMVQLTEGFHERQPRFGSVDSVDSDVMAVKRESSPSGSSETLVRESTAAYPGPVYLPQITLGSQTNLTTLSHTAQGFQEALDSLDADPVKGVKREHSPSGSSVTLGHEQIAEHADRHENIPLAHLPPIGGFFQQHGVDILAPIKLEHEHEHTTFVSLSATENSRSPTPCAIPDALAQTAESPAPGGGLPWGRGLIPCWSNECRDYLNIQAEEDSNDSEDDKDEIMTIKEEREKDL